MFEICLLQNWEGTIIILLCNPHPPPIKNPESIAFLYQHYVYHHHEINRLSAWTIVQPGLIAFIYGLVGWNECGEYAAYIDTRAISLLSLYAHQPSQGNSLVNSKDSAVLSYN